MMLGVAFLFLTLISPSVVWIVSGHKILLLTPPVSRGSKSHLHLMIKFGETLAAEGNNVSIIMQGEQTMRSKPIHQDRCPSAVNKTYAEWYGKELQKLTPNMMRGQTINRENMKKFGAIFLEECHMLLRNKELLLKHKQARFDLVIIDQIHICGYLYAWKLGVKYITLECSSYLTLLADSNTPAPLAYVPVFTSRLSDRMDFFGRLKNAVMAPFMRHFMISIVTSPYDDIKDQYKLASGKSVQELRMEAELFLINSDVSFEFPRPLMPNTVMIGGMLTRPAKPLPTELENFVLEAGSAGVIVVSFGSALDLSLMPDLVEMFIKALRDLPQRVVWGSKFKPENLPSNILIMPWIPQKDLLGHASTKAFITHGGINSLWEAVDNAVPTYVIPSTADAYDNAIRLSQRGMLLWKSYVGLTYELLRTDVISLINDKKYKDAALFVSSVFHDQPQTPRDRAVFWVNHVIKHDGGAHLRSAAFDLTFYKEYMLDVLAFIVSITTVTIILILCCCRMCFRKFKSLFPAQRQPMKYKESEGDENSPAHSVSSSPKRTDHHVRYPNDLINQYQRHPDCNHGNETRPPRFRYKVGQ